MLLATDLDGTFLGGSESQQKELYEWLKSEENTTIYVTGRGIESILSLLSDPLVGKPTYIIADVGATVMKWENGQLSEVTPIQERVLKAWPGQERILQVLADYPELTRQTVPQQNRCSFVLKDASLLPEIRRIVAQLDCDVIYSLNHYLDIMPAGVAKGSTLEILLEWLGINPDEVLVAGDTLNDLSLYQTPYRGVVVGGAESALLRATADMPKVYQAKEEGAGGIKEALQHFGFWGPSGQSAKPLLSRGKSELVVGYHRPPFAESFDVTSRSIQMAEHASPNGIIPTLLGLFSDGTAGAWVAWSEAAHQAGLAAEEARQYLDREKYANLVLSRIPLAKEDVDRFYRVFSKEAFWPVIFSFVEKPHFNHEHWRHYCEINQQFARKIAEEAAHGAKVWLHDYNLWMVPGELRRLRPDLRIAFFHHTSFPSADIFSILPWSGEILNSLLQCDYVGFHIPLYARHFTAAVESLRATKVLEVKPCAPHFLTFGCAVGIAEYPAKIQTMDRIVRLGAHPVGIDLKRIESIVNSPQFDDSLAELERTVGTCRTILSIERLDYVKGPLEKLIAFENFLELYPEYCGKITLVNVLTPPQEGIEIYDAIRAKVDETVGRINGRFSQLGWTPVTYLYRPLSFDEVVGLCAVSEIAWITPLRDGLNLVAKEYVATNALCKRSGKLILSQFAGAAAELFGAILTNPYDQKSLIDSLRIALAMESSEANRRLEVLFEKVHSCDVFAWGEEFMNSAFESPAPDEPKMTHHDL